MSGGYAGAVASVGTELPATPPALASKAAGLENIGMPSCTNHRDPQSTDKPKNSEDIKLIFGLAKLPP